IRREIRTCQAVRRRRGAPKTSRPASRAPPTPAAATQPPLTPPPVVFAGTGAGDADGCAAAWFADRATLGRARYGKLVPKDCSSAFTPSPRVATAAGWFG